MSYGFGTKLKQHCDQYGSRAVGKVLDDAIREKKVDPYKIRIGEVCEAFLGRDYLRVDTMLNAIKYQDKSVLESTEGMDASAFSAITGQLLVTIIKEKYNAPEFIGDRLMETIPNPGGNLTTHKIPYQSDVLDKGQDKLEMLQPFPQTKFLPSWVTMPAPEKRGQICAVSKEMLYSDLTGQTQKSVGSVATAMRYYKEERQLKVVMGIVNNYSWNDNALNTYVPTTAGVGNYINKILSMTLSDYNDINSIEQLFWKMVDPITGRRIMARPNTVLCMPSKRYALKRILNATEVRSGDITTGAGTQTIGSNPLDQSYTVLTSPIAEQVLLDAGLSASDTKEQLFWGDFPKAFFYREVYPFQTINAPANNPMEFNQDIVLAVRVSEFGIAGVMDPRYAVYSDNRAS